jgi:hypothetical protein
VRISRIGGIVSAAATALDKKARGAGRFRLGKWVTARRRHTLHFAARRPTPKLARQSMDEPAPTVSRSMELAPAANF